MADVTFPVALAALRAECGEPVCMGGLAVWSFGARDTVTVTLMDDMVAGLVLHVHDADTRDEEAWLLARAHPLTPLADAVRDAGAWLRGHHGR